MNPIENFTVDEGLDANGVRKQVHFGGDDVVTQLTFDAEPILKEAAAARQANEGQRWGEGKVVGKLPLAVMNQLLAIKDRTERDVATMNWLRNNPAFITYKPHFEAHRGSVLS
jgi:hypothetical protein